MRIERFDPVIDVSPMFDKVVADARITGVLEKFSRTSPTSLRTS